LCSGNHDLDERSPEGEKISRWIGDGPELGVACDGDSLTIGDSLFTVCPWWMDPLVKARIDNQLREAAAVRPKRVDLGPSRAAGEFAYELGRQALFRRRRARAMESESYQPSMSDLGARAQIAVHPRRFVVRPGSAPPGCFNTGLQPGRPPVYIVLDIDDGRAFWLSAASEQCIDLNAPLQRAGSACQPIRPAWLTSLGQIADPILARPPSATG